jgi:hypothetical protein
VLEILGVINYRIFALNQQRWNMKLRKIIVLAIALCSLCAQGADAQTDPASQDLTYKVIKQNGSSFVGKIISRDAREILLETESIGLVYIPKHEIQEIFPVKEGEKEISGGLFSTRYFLTTNGFAINKGDNYIQWNLFGPDFQFGVADNVTLGIMTSWVGMPVIGTAKYSKQFGDKLAGGLGFLGGTGSWAHPRYGLILPFGFLSVGDPVNNLNFSTGYGLLFTEETERTIVDQPSEYYTNSVEYNEVSRMEGRPLFSIAAMFRINDKFSFVFDSFIMTAGKDRETKEVYENWNDRTGKGTYYYETRIEKTYPLVVLSPGLRFQANDNSSFQFGFTGIHFDGEFVPLPIPMVQWFKRI